MTDPLTKIDELAKAARREKAPTMDVSGRILAAISERESVHEYAPLQWIAIGSIVTATAMGVSLVSLYRTWSDPLNTLLFEFFWGLL